MLKYTETDSCGTKVLGNGTLLFILFLDYLVDLPMRNTERDTESWVIKIQE